MRSSWALVAVAATACLRPGAPCAGRDGCPGKECLASRCSELNSEPVPPGSRRVVVEPTTSAVSRRGSEGRQSDTVTFGARHGPAERLYLSFEAETLEHEVAAAFLLLTPSTATEQTPKDVPLLVRGIVEPWTPARVVAGAPPRLGAGRAFGIARARALTRIDVTALLRKRDGAVTLGVAVMADGESGHGVTFVTGSAANAPRLEIYTRAPGPG